MFCCSYLFVWSAAQLHCAIGMGFETVRNLAYQVPKGPLSIHRGQHGLRACRSQTFNFQNPPALESWKIFPSSCYSHCPSSAGPTFAWKGSPRDPQGFPESPEGCPWRSLEGPWKAPESPSASFPKGSEGSLMRILFSSV